MAINLEDLRRQWSLKVRQYPSLARFGDSPWDAQGMLIPEARAALLQETNNLGRGARRSPTRAYTPSPVAQRPVAPTLPSPVTPFPQMPQQMATPMAPQMPPQMPQQMATPMPQLPNVAESRRVSPRYEATAPAPVDWGERGMTALSGLDPVGNIKGIAGLLTSPIDMWKEFRKDPGWGAIGRPLVESLGDIPLIEKTFGTWADIVAPGAALAFEKIPGLRKQGVIERARQLREQGYGPLHSVQAAYRQAQSAGEIPWWQDLPVGILTDPVELIPGVGITAALAGGVGRTAGRVARVAKAMKKPAARAGREVAEEAAAPAARAAEEAAATARAGGEVPRTVQRIEEPEVVPSFDKPQGLYTSSADVASPHLDLGGKRYTYDIDPNANILSIDATDLVTTNRGRSVGQSAGVGALRNLVGEDEATRILALSKQAAIEEMTQKYPNVQWGKYFDTQEIAEGYAGNIARERGYDAIWAIDQKAPDFNEFVVLNKKIATPTPDVATPAARVAEEAVIDLASEVDAVHAKLSNYKRPNSTIANRELDKLEAKGIEVDEARDFIEDYKDIDRADFEGADGLEEYAAERADAWDEVLGAIENLEADEVLLPIPAEVAPVIPYSMRATRIGREVSEEAVPPVPAARVSEKIIPPSPEDIRVVKDEVQGWKTEGAGGGKPPVDDVPTPPGGVDDSASSLIVDGDAWPWLTRFLEKYWDQLWGIRGLTTGRGFKARLLGKKPVLEGDSITPGIRLQNMVDLSPGRAKAGVMKYQLISSDIINLAPEGLKIDDFVWKVEDFLIAKHGDEVFRAKPSRVNYGEYSREQLIEMNDNLARDPNIRQIEQAAGRVKQYYADTLDLLQKDGYITKANADIMRRDYPWYNPLRYLDDEEMSHVDSGQFDKSVGFRRSGREKPTKRGVGLYAENPIYALSEEGTEATLVRPMQALFESILHIDYLIDSNRIKKLLVELGQETGEISRTPVARKARFVAKDKEGKAVFRSFSDEEGTLSYFDPKMPGKRQVFDVDDYVTRELDFLNTIQKKDNPLTWLNGFKRNLLTTWNPVFAVGNAINDMLVVLLTRRVAPWTVASQWGRTLKTSFGTLETDPFMQAYILAGGRQQRYYGEAGEEIFRKMARSTGVEDVGTWTKYWRRLHGKPGNIPDAEMAATRADIVKTGGKPTSAAEAVTVADEAFAALKQGTIRPGKLGKEWVSALGEAGEMAPRLAAAQKKLTQLRPLWRDELKSGKLTPQGLANRPEMKEAVVDALDATINFARGGSVIKSLNRYILFLNAAMEGMKVPMRAPQNQGFKKYGVTLGSVALGQMTLTMYNQQYPEYFDIPLHERLTSVVLMLPSTEKDDYGNPKPRRLNIIPKTREFSTLLGSTTYMVEKLFKESPVEFKQFVGAIVGEMSPGSMVEGPIGKMPMLPVPEILETAFEIGTNYDFYRNTPIIPEDLQRKDPAEQYKPWTSPAIKAAADTYRKFPLPGETIFGSPMMLNHLFNGLFGGVANEVVIRGGDLLVGMMAQDVDPEIRALAEQYGEFEGITERKRFLADLPRETREQVEAEIRRPEDDLRTKPFVGGIVRKFSPKRTGEIFKTKTEVAARITGIDEKENKNAGKKLATHRDELLKAQEQADTTVDLEDQSSKGQSDRIRWREAHGRIQDKWSGIMASLEQDYPDSVYAADDETKKAYYEARATAGGTMPDTRAEGQVLASMWYSIRPSDRELSDTDRALGLVDLDLYYDEREAFRASLSPRERTLLDEELTATRTPTEVQYIADRQYISDTGFWNILDNLVKKFGLEEQYRKYKSLRGNARTEFLNSPESWIPGKRQGLKEALRIAKIAKDRMRIEDARKGGELERRLLYWGYYQKPITERYQGRVPVAPSII